jgi:16S rRNA (guanine966-N2)-methyltransferase
VSRQRKKLDQSPKKLRIIGGQWRGRKLNFTPAPGLRPTGDRVRETLFNWLAPNIQGARCLDLFAGSGVLGIEALSRGAQSCQFVDMSSSAITQIQQHLVTLNIEGSNCHRQNAQQFLQQAEGQFDIVFIDPPFGLGLIVASCTLLQQRGLVSESACVYLEQGVQESPPELPTHWLQHRSKVAGDVRYSLLLTAPQ